MPAKKKAAKPPVKLYAVSYTVTVVIAAKNEKAAIKEYNEQDTYDLDEVAKANKTVETVATEIMNVDELPSKKWRDTEPFGEDAPRETDDEGNMVEFADVLTCGAFLVPKKKGKK